MAVCYYRWMQFSDWMRHLRQPGFFLIVGLIQLAFDCLVFVAVTALGLSVSSGNILGRIGGAWLGFRLNGRYTFASDNPSPSVKRQLYRFTVSWCLLTVASTVAVLWAASAHALQGAWLAKPAIEAILALVSFFVSRYWIFR